MIVEQHSEPGLCGVQVKGTNSVASLEEGWQISLLIEERSPPHCRETYGYESIWRILQDEGIPCGKHRVRRLMR
ncbi:MAG: IS3 family transposase, partial [Chloroflexi bacterium]|nr:IS3 family transposase [Chloroflexota bacterium]